MAPDSLPVARAAVAGVVGPGDGAYDIGSLSQAVRTARAATAIAR